MTHSRILMGIVVVAFVAACGGSGTSGGGYTTGTNPGGTGGTPSGGTPNPTSTNEVTLSDATFQPGSISVPKGTTVTWKWAACTDNGYGGYAGCVMHSVIFDDGTSSPTQSEGTFTRTFANAGTFKYHCAIHGTAMSGQVTVQ